MPKTAKQWCSQTQPNIGISRPSHLTLLSHLTDLVLSSVFLPLSCAARICLGSCTLAAYQICFVRRAGFIGTRRYVGTWLCTFGRMAYTFLCCPVRGAHISCCCCIRTDISCFSGFLIAAIISWYVAHNVFVLSSLTGFLFRRSQFKSFILGRLIIISIYSIVTFF